MSNRDFALFLCDELDDGSGLQFWCPFCRAVHLHGGPATKAQHVLGHCHSELGRSHFPNGYLIQKKSKKAVPTKSKNQLAHIVREKAAE